MKKCDASVILGLALFGLLAGCSEQSPAPSASDRLASMSAPGVDGSAYLLASEPDGARDVIQARQEVSHGDDVVIVGRIGGSASPWIDGRAAFSIVDGSLKACSDIPGDQCEMPWDYCCETTKLPSSTALIKVVDAGGELVKADPRQLLNVKELSTVIVAGKAERDEAGNLTILATGVFVKQR